jgi:1-phosphatidylinositol phosphodiesterase
LTHRYAIPGATAVGEKAQALINHLEPTVEPRGDGAHPFTLSYATASKFPDANPRWVATGSGSGGMSGLIGATSQLFANFTGNSTKESKMDVSDVGVNARLVKWLLERAAEGKRPRATVLLDFYRDNMRDDANLATLLASLNFVTDN